MADDRYAPQRGARRHWLAPVALVAVAALAAVACGDDNKSSDTASQAPTSAAAPVTTVAATTTTAAAAGAVKTATNSQFGTILTDPASGKTLYTRDSDPAGASACTGNCAATWPPLVLPQGVTSPVAPAGVSGTFASAPRPDDATKLQVVLNGKALYTYSADTAAGETKGDGVGGVWHVAKAA
jgi:predicted lipoprotein with Yx(FWY)xxD motif